LSQAINPEFTYFCALGYDDGLIALKRPRLEGVLAKAASCTGSATQADKDIDLLRREVADLRVEVKMLRLANAELERVVVRDTLTPLFNRRHFLSGVHDRINRASRYGSRSVVIFVDVDNMKAINDVYGHMAGDFALMHVASIINASVRSTDIAARLGGDEFALILDELGDEQARQKIESLDALMASTPCQFGAECIPVTASFGHTAIAAHDTEADILDRADQAMYTHKRARREAARAQRSDK